MEYHVWHVDNRKSLEGRWIFFCLVCRGSQTALGKFKCLPSAIEIHSANSFFAECLISCTRQKASLPSAICLPCVFRGAHGNQLVCRVPVKMLSAKLWALSKLAVSDSDCNTNGSNKIAQIIYWYAKSWKHYITPESI